MFFDEKLSKSTSTYNVTPGPYTSIADIVETMNTRIQEISNHNETCIRVKVSRRTQKVVIMLANDTSGLAFGSTDLGHTFCNNVGNKIWVLLIGKLLLIYNWLKIATFQPTFDKIYFFYRSSQPFSDVMQKEIQNLEFVQGVNFELFDSLKNNGTKYLLKFDVSCEEICVSKAFVGIVTAGRRRRLSTVYIEHHLFHQSKLARVVELQNTHIILFKSPRDVMQVFILGTQLVSWFRAS